ncbi:hypothetical protein [Nocardia sp. NBC_01009]|uniref:hypothetical protein n=1 Tax=Nocardia sp. NBC_01009 TaxID=2975996 RepID=UPI00386B0B9F|nr:hypothetical protein OHA42_17865 [Nocardia sp. NBC_01009]
MDTDISCPTCGRIDCVQSVPAIRATGVQSVSGSDSYNGIGITSSGFVPVFGTTTIERTHTSMLAQALAPEPAQRSSERLLGCGALMLIPLLAGLLLTFAAFHSPDPGGDLPSAIVVLTFMLLALATPTTLAWTAAAKRERRSSRIARGRPMAYTVWRAGQYCHRCGVCFWPYPPAADVPARQSLSPNQFRWIVWNTGGYADL